MAGAAGWTAARFHTWPLLVRHAEADQPWIVCALSVPHTGDKPKRSARYATGDQIRPERRRQYRLPSDRDDDLDLVFVLGCVSASFFRLILFDRRGTGLSGRVADVPTLEQRMGDVRAVLDAIGPWRAALLDVSEGGALCALFATTYPKRTAVLVMTGSFARRLRTPDLSPGRSAGRVLRVP